jgi:hypothetical protein
VETVYDDECCSLTIQIPAVDVSKEIKVVFAQALKIADTGKIQCYKILQRAQMDYNDKQMIWEVISKSVDGIADLEQLDMDPSVKASIFEVI